MASLVLVEDDDLMRHVMELALRAAGHEVEAFEAVAPALGRLLGRDGAPTVELVVTDLHLPDGDGLTLLELARRARGELPGVLVTGGAADEDAARAAALGVPVLRKPFRRRALVELCEEHIARARRGGRSRSGRWQRVSAP